MQIAIDKNNSDNVYCCDYEGRVYASIDGGAEWGKFGQVPGEMSRYLHVYPMVCG